MHQQVEQLSQAKMDTPLLLHNRQGLQPLVF